MKWGSDDLVCSMCGKIVSGVASSFLTQGGCRRKKIEPYYVLQPRLNERPGLRFKKFSRGLNEDFFFFFFFVIGTREGSEEAMYRNNTPR